MIEQSQQPDEPTSFGDEAAEMVPETEVEETPQAGGDAGRAGGPSVDDLPVDQRLEFYAWALGEMKSAETALQQEAAEHAERADRLDGEVEQLSARVDELSAQEELLAGRVEGLTGQVEGLTDDLQRNQAEFLNYKRRVERDRQRLREDAKFDALSPIIEVLDTIDRAREHGELEGGFKAVAEQLESAVAASGLVRFGDPGDEFDPNLHDALSHVGTDPDISVTTVKLVAKSGYLIGDRVVRAAQVLVADPAS